MNANPKVVEKIFENESSEGCSMTVPLKRAANLLDRFGLVPDSKVAAQTKEIFSISFFWPDWQSYLKPQLKGNENVSCVWSLGPDEVLDWKN